MEITVRALNELRPYEHNPKTHPKSQVDNIARSIQDFGFRQPLVIDGDGNAMDAGTLYRMPEKMTFTAAGSGIPLAQFGEPEGTTSTARAEVRIEAYVVPENLTVPTISPPPI